MDKKALKELLENLTVGSDITVNFNGNKGGVAPGSKAGTERGIVESGEFRVLESKRGRGKDGSRLVTMMCLKTSQTVEIGTPTNEEILNIVLADGTLHGDKEESIQSRKYQRADETTTMAFKESLKPLLKLNGLETRVQVDSTIPEFNGVFMMTNPKLNVGRFGQITINLKNPETGFEWTLQSHNHAGVVQSVKVTK